MLDGLAILLTRLFVCAPLFYLAFVMVMDPIVIARVPRMVGRGLRNPEHGFQGFLSFDHSRTPDRADVSASALMALRAAGWVLAIAAVITVIYPS